MSQVTIVEYQPMYAKAIADMWNRSSSGWNGRQFNKTKKIVLQDEENSTHLNLYLAVLDGSVIGYAKFAKYEEECDVSYIELLSVDPDWHGRGVGRELVQKCVLRAAELGYERLDLFTWAGNTKAVPLYKKCGFFWEKMESQATHLMNFVPGLLNNEFLKPYFEYFDWYQDSKRPLEILPDGRDDNGFELYDYIWEKEGKRLEVTFEKSGRGIVRLSTPDFELSTKTTDSKPIFGLDYDFTYTIQPKSDKRIEIILEGEKDRQIDFSYHHQGVIDKVTTLQSSFFIQPLDDEVSEWLTAPCIVTRASINGKNIRFKTGLSIQYPLEAKMRMERNLLLPGSEKEFCLNIMNHFSVPCLYRIEFTDVAPLVLSERMFEVRLAPGEKSFLPVQFTTSESCMFTPTLNITAQPSGLKEIHFTKSLEYPIFTLTSKDQRKIPNKYYLINGIAMLQFIQREQKNWGYFAGTNGLNFNLLPPVLGKPYSDEFDQEVPYDVEVEDLGYANQLVMYYRSNDFPGVEFARVYKLYPTGILACSIRIIKLPDEYPEMIAKFTMGMEGRGLVFMQNGKMIRLEKEMLGVETSGFAGEEIGSNWLYSEYDDSSCAVIWDQKWKGFFSKWWVSFEVNLADYKARGIWETEPLQLFLHVFTSAHVVKRLAEGVVGHVIPSYPTLELRVNDGVPFIHGHFEISLLQHQIENLRGEFIIDSQEGSVSEQKQNHTNEEGLRQITWPNNLLSGVPMEIIRCEARLPLYTLKRNQVVFSSSGQTRILPIEGHPELLSADNGMISITAARDARLPGLISLKYQGQEWLDEAYPDFEIKSYYNPYPGGMKVIPMQLRMMNILSEEQQTESASLMDQWGNRWDGIVVRTSIRNSKMLEGLIYDQYYVMMPGVPVLAIIPYIVKSDGYAEYQCLQLHSHFNPTGNISDVSMRIPLEDKSKIDIHAGREAFNDRCQSRQLTVISSASEIMLHLVTMSRTYHQLQINTEICEDRLSLYSEFNKGKQEFMDAAFVIFSKHDLEQEWMYPLLSTKFEVRSTK